MQAGTSSPPSDPVRADIGALAWIAGRWVGTHGEDEIEETWAPALGGGMVGMFRAVAASHPRFYELITFDAEGAGLVCRFRHFNRDMTGWEEKDAPLELDLVAVREGEALFLRRGTRRWMTYRLAAPDRLTVFFENEDRVHDAEDEYRFARA